ncbi:hypothetical protein BBJ28_00008675 [Nothophytophthora sp. Chile5]|nr:hypothetical protein BBJ28_00008675 [Nothophytophthora sp. Chile5]
METIVESFTPVVSTGSEDEGLPPDCTSLATLIRLQSEAAPVSNDSIPEQKALEDHFELLRDGQALPASSTIASRSTEELCGLTPSSSTATGSASGVYEWLFPLGFTWDAGAVTAVEITLLSTSSVPHKPVGRGRLNLSIATAQHLNKDGTPLRHTVIPITLEGDNSRTLGHVALRLRWWDAPAWDAFVLGIPARRVVCTNRWKRSPRLALAWMGALFRGLNRHPVASFCDAGGISSVLAELLAESPSSNDQLQQQEVQQHQQRQGSGQDHGNGEATAVTALLREQVTHLQTQGDSQRQQIERVRAQSNELDTRLAAIKTCGLELKDEQLRKLEEQVQATQRREQQQLAELLAPANSSGSSAVVRPENQAASQRFTLLLTKYKELDREFEAAKQQLASAQRSLVGYDELETRHAELQEAHLVQASLVQRLQRDKQHAAALKEKVIRQFEQTVAQQSAAASNLQQPPTDDEDGGAETHEALLRVRVQVLEQQLQTNARDAAAELSALRMRVFELELDGSRSPRR